MALLYIALLAVAATSVASVLLFARLRLLNSAAQSASRLPDVNRYRPMLRLLADNDMEFANANRSLRNRIRAQRRDLFRGYLRCMAKDYGRLLAGIRQVMVESGVDRPDLAKALAKNRMMFALALCRIELNLQLHALGIGSVDVSGLVEAFQALRGTVGAMTPVAVAAY